MGPGISIGDSWPGTGGHDRGHTRGHPSQENPYFRGGNPAARHPFFSKQNRQYSSRKPASFLLFILKNKAVFLEEYCLFRCKRTCIPRRILLILFEKRGDARPGCHPRNRGFLVRGDPWCDPCRDPRFPGQESPMEIHGRESSIFGRIL